MFHRVPLEPRITSDQTGQLGGVYVTYNAVDPDIIADSDTTYSSANSNSGLVGQSLVYVVGSTDNGTTWNEPVAVDPAGGHQYFPDIDAHTGRMGVVWQESRTDPGYTIQLPFGNTADATSCGTNIVGTYFGYSFDPAFALRARSS